MYINILLTVICIYCNKATNNTCLYVQTLSKSWSFNENKIWESWKCTYQISCIGEEGLLDQGKSVATQATLQLQQVSEYPRFVLKNRTKIDKPFSQKVS